MALDTKYKRASLADVYIPGASATSGATASEVVAALMAYAVSGTVTFLQAQRALLAATAGKPVFSDDDTNLVFRDLGDTKDVIDVTLDSDGNVTALTFDLTE
jgi:hypothetical protein